VTAYIYSKSDKQSASFQLGWRRIFAKRAGAIYLFPSEATGFIAQWQPELRISCNLPAKTRNIAISFHKCNTRNSVHKDIKFPELVLSHKLFLRRYHEQPKCDCTTCQKFHPAPCYCHKCKKNTIRKTFYIFYQVSEARGGGLCAYTAANVYASEGRICHGTSDVPISLRQANSSFWTASFNNDMSTFSFNHSYCTKKVHRRSARCHMQFSARKSSCRRSVEHQCGCPDKSEGYHIGNCPCMIGCRCLCNCICCLDKCQCLCGCNCCRGICGCACSCDMNYEFADAIEKHVPNARVNRTDLLTGSRYISTTTKVAGTFISYNSEFIKKFSEVKEQDRYKRDLIIGFAKLKKDGDWRLITKKGEITLTDREVVLL